MGTARGPIRSAIDDVSTARQSFVAVATAVAESFSRQATLLIDELHRTVDPEVAENADPSDVVRNVVKHLHHHITDMSERVEQEVNHVRSVLEA